MEELRCRDSATGAWAVRHGEDLLIRLQSALREGLREWEKVEVDTIQLSSTHRVVFKATLTRKVRSFLSDSSTESKTIAGEMIAEGSFSSRGTEPKFEFLSYVRIYWR